LNYFFDNKFKQKYIDSGLIPDGKLQHLISDAATMQIIRWTKGGFGMAAHNYDGDMLTDEVAQVHRSPGFITSNLIGKREDGVMIKEYEASHGTVADLWHAHLRGEETSLNPLGMADALLSAMDHAAEIHPDLKAREQILNFTKTLKTALHNTFRYGQGTRDMSGPTGLTTEQFIDKVAWRLGRYLAAQAEEDVVGQEEFTPDPKFRRNYNVDKSRLKELFTEFDKNKNGAITLDELETMLVKLGVAPMADPLKRGSASSDKKSSDEN